MPRKLPNCAHCGNSLKDTDYMLRQFPQLRGKPEIGWHAVGGGDCIERDPICQLLSAASADKLIVLLRQIESRGDGRLVANQGWLKVVSAEQDRESIPS